MIYNHSSYIYLDNMMLILIKIAVENRLKWIIMLLLHLLEMILMFLYSVQLHNAPLFYCLNVLEAWCLPPRHFNDLNAWFLLPFFNDLDVGHYTCLPPRLPSTLILKLDWLTSDFCLFPFLVIRFWIRRSNSIVLSILISYTN